MLFTKIPCQGQERRRKKKRFLVKIRWDTNQKIFLNPRISRQNQQTNRDNMHTDHQKYLNHWIMQGSKCGAPHPPKLKDILTYGDSYAISRILSLCTKWYLINYLMHCTLLSSLCKVTVTRILEFHFPLILVHFFMLFKNPYFSCPNFQSNLNRIWGPKSVCICLCISNIFFWSDNFSL